MKFKFTNQAKTRATAFTDKTPTGPKSQTLLVFEKKGDDWSSELKDGIELAEGKREEIEADFFQWIDNQATPTTEPEEAPTEAPPAEPDDLRPAEVITAPKPHPVSGTTSPEYLEYAAQHFTEAQFSALYADRWHKPTFRTYAKAVAPTFYARAKSFPH
jgi:hypothetical protein